MSKTGALKLPRTALADATADLRASAGASSTLSVHPEALLDLPPGEARASLLAVHDILEARLPGTDIKIYEAGGGSTCFLPLDVLRRSHVTVVDIDEDQIRNNDYAQRTILGDVQTYRFAPESFDLVICYNVIEHLSDADAALDGFCDSLKPGGLMLIGAPNPSSLSGIVTRFSPHWFHIWFYRHVRGDAKAGQPGHVPFPIFFHPLVELPKLEAFAEVRGLQVIYRKVYESPRFPEMRANWPTISALVDSLAVVLNFFLGGKSDVRHGDYHLILRKR